MAAFEKIVRPFDSDLVFTARRALPEPPPVEESSEEIPQLVIEGKAEALWVEEPGPGTMGFEVDQWTEDTSKRVTVEERVSNPEDSSQYVDIEKIKSMELVNTINRERIIIRPWQDD